MPMTNFLRSATVLLCAAALAACEKNAVQDIAGPAEGARVKFFNFGLNAPAVNFYANDAKVTAVTSATGVESTNGVAFGAAGNAGLYNILSPGQYTFTGRIAATVDKDLVVSRITGTVETGKAYSVYMSGLYDATAKTVEGFVIEDAVPPSIDFTQAQVRFVNAIFNASPIVLTGLNTSVTGSSEVVFGGTVAYKAGGAFTAVPAGVYNLSARSSPTGTALFTRTAVSFVAGRVYTITARGDITVPGTTATNRPFLDNTLNR